MSGGEEPVRGQPGEPGVDGAAGADGAASAAGANDARDRGAGDPEGARRREARAPLGWRERPRATPVRRGGEPESGAASRLGGPGARLDAALAGAPGLAVGPYVLVRSLGAGAFGEVWEARHRDLERVAVALKLPRGEAALAQLRRDGVVQHRLAAPEIVRVVGMDLRTDPPYVAYALVRGETLADRIARGPLPVEEALTLAGDVARALAHAHGLGVLHLDLKPSNVLIDGLGRARVTDFGLVAALRGPASALISADLASASAAGSVVVGTLAYMAPEQRQGAVPDTRADVHALGVLLFECLTGRLPTGHELPSRVRPRLPPSVDALYRALVAGLDDRLADGTAAARALAAATIAREVDAPLVWSDRRPDRRLRPRRA